MNLVPANVALPFEVTFDRADLFVGMSVYNTSGASPVLVAGPSAMELVANYTYVGKFSATNSASYVIIKAVYTDDTLTELSPDYSQGSESIFAQLLAQPNLVPTQVVGVVIPNDPIIGVVDC